MVKIQIKIKTILAIRLALFLCVSLDGIGSRINYNLSLNIYKRSSLQWYPMHTTHRYEDALGMDISHVLHN